ncbi:MAG TPA: nucleotidyltransferase domain-containing protein [Bryobacteraceae bacterium]|jgi:predicted nucleotidyltransferase|nr:nucleotidyltransferase domain-containing protein [Bryobacteraceae bacterium]
MTREIPAELRDMPESVALALTGFVETVQQVFGDDLKSVVLYGSAAEGRMRATSDVNLLLVFSKFDAEKAATIRAPYAAARAAIRLGAMFLLESEVRPAMDSFGQKFSDILRRHRVLHGSDPFVGAHIPREAVILRVKQVLLNLTLRLRMSYVQRGATPERISALIADSASPLRSCAATLDELEGKPAVPPKEALANFVAALGEPAWTQVLARISETREDHLLDAATADQTLLCLIDLAARLRARVDALG